MTQEELDITNSWDIRNYLPDYDPSQDWIGVDSGDGRLLEVFNPSDWRFGDILTAPNGARYHIRYVDCCTLVTRRVNAASL